jgi:hypothetical protein
MKLIDYFFFMGMICLFIGKIDKEINPYIFGVIVVFSIFVLKNIEYYKNPDRRKKI